MKPLSLISAIILIAKISFASIVLDATSSADVTNSAAIAISHTITSGNILIVNITSKNQAISTVEWNNEPMILGSEINQNNMRVAMYYLKSPATGTYYVNITTSGPTDISAIVTSFSGVELTSPFGNFTLLGNQSISASINVEGSSNDVVIDAIGCKNQTPEADTSQVVTGIIGTSIKTGSSRKEVNGNTTMTWNMNVINDWGAIGVSLKPEFTLPINLVRFTAIPENSSVTVKWTTGTEKNNDYFTIQRSSDGNNFKDISRIDGAGNSNSLLNYSYTDDNPLSGTSYYRLKQTDFNNLQTQSEIVSVSLTKTTGNSDFYVFPNPSVQGENINIKVNGMEAEKEVLIVVKNVFGEELYSKVTFSDFNGEVLEAFDTMNRLPSGTYIIVASSLNKVYSKKLIIH